jgi:hypothetical protein
MPSLRLSTVSLMLSVILWGTLLGGIAYSHLVYFPAYLSALPDSAVVVNGPYGLNEGVFWVLIHPLLILSLVTTLVLNWKLKPRRKLVAVTLSVYFVTIVVTSLYFVPELGAFKHSPGSGLSPAEWLVRTDRWQHLSWVRGTICYLNIIPLLLALMIPADARVVDKVKDSRQMAVGS